MPEAKPKTIPAPQVPKADPKGQSSEGLKPESGLGSRLWKEATKSISPAVLGQWLVGLGGRRFFLALGAGVVSSVLVWYGKITPEIYRDVVLGTVGMYIAGNTFQKVKAQQSG